MRRIRGIVLLVIIGGVCLSGRPAHAEQAKFKQLILPLDCVFETVNDGLGTIHYLTPAECGQIIPPTPGGDTTTDNNVTTPATPARGSTSRQKLFGPLVPDLTPAQSANGHGEVSVISGGGPLLLNNRTEAVSNRGYSVRVQSGNVLFYRPTDNAAAAVRSLIISAVNPDGIGVHIPSIRYFGFIPVHQSIQLDQLQRGSPALRIEVRSIQGQYAVVNFRLLQSAAKKPATPLPITTQAVVLIVTIVIMIALRLRPQWFGLTRR